MGVCMCEWQPMTELVQLQSRSQCLEGWWGVEGKENWSIHYHLLNWVEPFIKYPTIN